MDKNNIGFLRLLLATLVLFSHSFPLMGYATQEPLMRLSGGQQTLGELAVEAFFALSGYLILQSWERRPDLSTFLKKRLLRIYPGFLCVSALGLLVVGPLVVPDTRTYFAAFRLKMCLMQLTLLHPYELPGPFVSNPIRPPIVNGSLWSIAYEFLCYLLVAGAGVTGLYRRRWLAPVLFAFAYILFALQEIAGWHYHAPVRVIFYFLNPDAWPRLLTYFAAGMFLYQWRDRLRLTRTWAGYCLLALFLSIPLHLLRLTLPLCGIYLLYYAAFRPMPSLHNIGRSFDLSYGIYLYAFPVQQTLIHFCGPSLLPGTLFLAAVPLTYGLAALSWVCIERPAQGLAQRYDRAKPDEK